MSFANNAWVIPFVFLIAGWLAFLRRKPMTKVWASGVATLLSLPIGSYLVMRIALPSSWYPNYGDHSPGVGVVFVPLLAGWVLCVIVWVAVAGITVASIFSRRHSN